VYNKLKQTLILITLSLTEKRS